MLKLDSADELGEFLGWFLLFIAAPFLGGQWGMWRLAMATAMIGALIARWSVVARYERRIDKVRDRVEDLEVANQSLRDAVHDEMAKRRIAERALRDLAQAREQFSRSSLN